MSSDTEHLHVDHRGVEKNLQFDSGNSALVLAGLGGENSGGDANDHGSPNKKKEKISQRLFASSGPLANPTNASTTTGGKLQIIQPDISGLVPPGFAATPTIAVPTGVAWKHDKFNEMGNSSANEQNSSSAATQKSSSPTTLQKDNSSKSKPMGEQRTNLPPPNASAAQVNKVPGDTRQVQTKPDTSLVPSPAPAAPPTGASKTSKKKKNNPNVSVVDQTTPTPQEAKSPSQPPMLPSSDSTHEDSTEKKTEKGKNKSQKQKNKQDGATAATVAASTSSVSATGTATVGSVEKKENSSSVHVKAPITQLKSPSKLEIIAPTPAAVPVSAVEPSGSTGTVEVVAGLNGKGNNRKNKKAKQQASNASGQNSLSPALPAPSPVEKSSVPSPAAPQLTKAQSRVVTIVPNADLVTLTAPPPPPPSPSVGASCSVFDCDDYLISELTENITATLYFGDVPKKRKRSKKKKNSDKFDEDGGGGSDDEFGEAIMGSYRESEAPEEAFPEDVVEDVELGQQSSKSSKKKKKNKKKNDEQQFGEQSSLPQNPQVQTDQEKHQSQGQKKQQEKGQKNQHPPNTHAAAEAVKSDKGNKQQPHKTATLQVSEPSMESKSGSKTQKGQQGKPQPPVLPVVEPQHDQLASNSIDNPHVEKEGKKKKRSRRKKKNQGSSEVADDLQDVDEEDGQDLDEDAHKSGVVGAPDSLASEPLSYGNTFVAGAGGTSAVRSYSMFEVNRKSVPDFDEDVPPGFEPTIDDKISTFLPSSLAMPSRTSLTADDSSVSLDLVNKSIDDLVAESLSSLSRLNLDSTIDALDIPLDFERDLQFSLGDSYFSMSSGDNSPSFPLRSPPLQPSDYGRTPPAPVGGSQLKPTARPFEPKRPPSYGDLGVRVRHDYPGSYPREAMDRAAAGRFPGGGVYPPRGVMDHGGRPGRPYLPGPGPERYHYDDGPEQFGGMSPEDVIISRLPGRRGMPPPGARGPSPLPPYGARPKPPPPPQYARDREGYHDMDGDYLQPPYFPPSSASISSKPSFAPPPRPPPRMDMGMRGGSARYPPPSAPHHLNPNNQPSFPGVEKLYPSGPPPPRGDRDSGSVPGINFTLASQQPRNHLPHHPPPPSQHW
jgi:hypothetical protein